MTNISIKFLELLHDDTFDNVSCKALKSETMDLLKSIGVSPWESLSPSLGRKDSDSQLMYKQEHSREIVQHLAVQFRIVVLYFLPQEITIAILLDTA